MTIEEVVQKLQADRHSYQLVPYFIGQGEDVLLVVVAGDLWHHRQQTHPPEVSQGRLYVHSVDGRGYEWNLLEAVAKYEGRIWGCTSGTGLPSVCLERAVRLVGAVNSRRHLDRI